MEGDSGEIGGVIRSTAVVPTLFRDGVAYMQALQLEALISSFGSNFGTHGEQCCARAVRTVARGIGRHALRLEGE